LHKQFDVTIAPGNSATVATGLFYLPFVSSAYIGTLTTIAYSLCVHTSVPDSLNDIEISNDFACGTFPVRVTGIDENSLETNPVELFPNPASDQITISALRKISSVELFEATGALLRTYAPTSNPMSLDVSQMPKGIYILRIHSGTSDFTRKFCVIRD
jgi:hypothetical protein